MAQPADVKLTSVAAAIAAAGVSYVIQTLHLPAPVVGVIAAAVLFAVARLLPALRAQTNSSDLPSIVGSLAVAAVGYVVSVLGLDPTVQGLLATALGGVAVAGVPSLLDRPARPA